jgi:hypothetical protein
MRFAPLVVFGVLLVGVCAQAPAQVIYEPVRYQFDASGNGNVYFYGGTDAAVHARARALSRDPRFGYVGGYQFVSSSRVVSLTRPPVYVDSLPFVDASRFGYTASDAANAAYRNVPTYFRKADLTPQPHRLNHGTIRISNSALPQGTILIVPTGRLSVRAD